MRIIHGLAISCLSVSGGKLINLANQPRFRDKDNNLRSFLHRVYTIQLQILGTAGWTDIHDPHIVLLPVAAMTACRGSPSRPFR